MTNHAQLASDMSRRLSNSVTLPAVSIVTVPDLLHPLWEDTVRSVLGQTLQQWEWVIVNDGSNDRAAQGVLQRLRQCGDARIHLIDQPNRGQPAAKNTGVAASSASLLL